MEDIELLNINGEEENEKSLLISYDEKEISPIHILTKEGREKEKEGKSLANLFRVPFNKPVLATIIGFLDAKDLCRLARVDKKLYEFISCSDLLWERILERDFQNEGGEDWKKFIIGFYHKEVATPSAEDFFEWQDEIEDGNIRVVSHSTKSCERRDEYIQRNYGSREIYSVTLEELKTIEWLSVYSYSFGSILMFCPGLVGVFLLLLTLRNSFHWEQYLPLSLTFTTIWLCILSFLLQAGFSLFASLTKARWRFYMPLLNQMWLSKHFKFSFITTFAIASISFFCVLLVLKLEVPIDTLYWTLVLFPLYLSEISFVAVLFLYRKSFICGSKTITSHCIAIGMNGFLTTFLANLALEEVLPERGRWLFPFVPSGAFFIYLIAALFIFKNDINAGHVFIPISNGNIITILLSFYVVILQLFFYFLFGKSLLYSGLPTSAFLFIINGFYAYKLLKQ